jgi:transposase
MNVHKNARLTPQGRLLFVERITQQGWSVIQAAQAAGLSTSRAYHWLARYRCGGAAALADRSSAPRRCRNRTSAERVAETKGLRRQRLTGPVIARQLGMLVSTVGKVLRRLALGKLAALEPKPALVRYQRERPGALILSISRSSAVSRRLGTASPAIPATGGAVPAGNTSTSVLMMPRGWPIARCCATSARKARCRFSNARPPGSPTTASPSSAS